MKELKDWYIEYGTVYGIVYGHDRISDGRFIHTSSLVDIVVNLDDSVEIHTVNSVYHTHMSLAAYDQFASKDTERIIGFEKYKDKYERYYTVPNDVFKGVLFVFDSELDDYYVGVATKSGLDKRYTIERHRDTYQHRKVMCCPASLDTLSISFPTDYGFRYYYDENKHIEFFRYEKDLCCKIW
jgi:hypothetical protein